MKKIRSLACGDHHPTILASFSSYKQLKGHHHCQEPESGILSDLLTAFSLSIVVFYPFLSSIRDGLKGKNFLKVTEWEFFSHFSEFCPGNDGLSVDFFTQQ